MINYHFQLSIYYQVNMLFENDKNIRVRFAPSPTGYLHIGGARTAIFNWLFARKNHGKFLLRIEDTDFARSNEDMVAAIYDGLKWLGLTWDEDPVFQSSRLDLYRNACEKLVQSGKAYYCFCSQQRIEALRAVNRTKRAAYFYDGHCRNLSNHETQTLLKSNVPKVIRFSVEPGNTTFADLIHGSLTFDNQEIDDFVILRSDNIPTYHLAVVVDDYDMKISHVIRGDDHLTNTPKQILLYRAFGWELPKFAHVPLILGSDKKRLSKRHGAASVSEYRDAGYLPESFFNFLALLGWSPGDDKEILSRRELASDFEIQNINKNSAIFDETKLGWMNGQYISNMSDEELYEKVQPILKEHQFFEIEKFGADYIKKTINLLKTRVRKIAEFLEYGLYFFKDPDSFDEVAVTKYWKGENLVDWLNLSSEVLSQIQNFTEEDIERAIRKLAEDLNISAAKLIHAIRLALTGFAVSPGLFELMAVLGKEVTIRRIKKAISILRKN